MLRQVLIALCLVVTSITTQATVISHYGYERDGASNVVTGGGLEWMMWDATKGLTIETALSSYKGWRLASNSEMVSLFNAFGLGRTNWTSSETLDQSGQSPLVSGKKTPFDAFLLVFGQTYIQPCLQADGCRYFNEELRSVRVVYGSDENHNGRYKQAYVQSDANYVYTNGYSKADNFASLSSDYLLKDSSWDIRGVALVRVPGSTIPAQVSTPSTLGVFALTLLAFGLRRRKPQAD